MPEEEASGQQPSELNQALRSAPPSADDESAETATLPARRRVLVWLSLSLGGLAAMAAGIPVLGFLFSPLRRHPSDVWREVMRLDDLPVGTTVKVSLFDSEPLPWGGFAARSAAWLRRESEQELVAFSIYCTHTGCPVRWEEGAQLFLCPCHGGAFYRTGAVASGPPPAPLERHPVRIRDGIIEVRTIGLPIPGS